MNIKNPKRKLTKKYFILYTRGTPTCVFPSFGYAEIHPSWRSPTRFRRALPYNPQAFLKKSLAKNFNLGSLKALRGEMLAPRGEMLTLRGEWDVGPARRK